MLGNANLFAQSRPAPVARLMDATAVSVNYGHAYELRATGEVVCWGQNSKGHLGDGSTIERFFPSAVLGVTGAIWVTSAVPGIVRW